MQVLVTGANRGIGLEFVRQLVARGDALVATAREPDGARDLAALAAAAGDRVTVLACDVGDPASVRAMAARLEGRAIDLLINNAGTYGGDHQRLGDLDLDDALATFRINALGPLAVTSALLPNLRRAGRARVVHVTSGMGSIADNTSGGYYGYRMSKAALNMASRSLAADLRADGIASAVINPGWVQTDMGGASATTPVAESVAGMLRAIDGLSLARSGEFLDWRGRAWSW